MIYKKILQNSRKYLEPSIVQECFLKGEINHVDKQVCGNGFSTSFLSLSPEPNKVNIIIAPNKAVLIEKRDAFFNQSLNVLNRVKFFFKESTDVNFNDADVLFFVADSFLLRKEDIKNISYKIDKVLIDEYHSVEIQSLFRRNLIDFESKVKSICNDSFTSIATVTASPNIFSKVDFLINNKFIKDTTINVSKDRESSLKRIKNDIKQGENVVVFTNSATLIYHLRNYKNEVSANFVIGENLTRSLVELVTVVSDKDANLTIVSSKGFEGFDIYYKDANVYFFEDRANEYETFFVSNLYQAINRTRRGAKYIEYNRLELSNKRKSDFKDIDKEVDLFINDSGLSIHSKQKKAYKKYKPFVIFSQDDSGVDSLKRNGVAINLHKESLMYDKPFPSGDFKKFLDDRKITVNHISEVNNRLNKKVKTKIKERNLLINSDLITALGLFGSDFRLDVIDLHSQKNGLPSPENRSLYLRHLNNYLRRKNYNGEYIASERETIALNILSNEKEFFSLVKDITKAYDTRSIDKYGLKNSLDYRNTFKKKSYNTVCKLVLMFANYRIGLPSKWVANRDYNLLTEIGVGEINLVADAFNTSVKEIDVKGCFPRVLYGLNNLELPSDFYGLNKRNKLTINVFLNDFFYDASQKSEKKLQKNNAILKFRNLGFDDKVIFYLMDKFFETNFKGDLFNFLSFHEKRIISDVKKIASEFSNDGAIRRHDSIIIFNNKSELQVLNRYEYLNVSGWFDIPEVKVLKLETGEKCDAVDVADYSLFQSDNLSLMAL